MTGSLSNQPDVQASADAEGETPVTAPSKTSTPEIVTSATETGKQRIIDLLMDTVPNNA